MFLIHVGYPSAAEEGRIARETTGGVPAPSKKPSMASNSSIFRMSCAACPVPDHIYDFVVDLVRRSRPGTETSPEWIRDLVTWGAGPRAVQYLILGAKARAALQGQLPRPHRGYRSARRACARPSHPDQFSCRIGRHHQPRHHQAAPRGSPNGCAGVKRSDLVDPKAVARLMRAQVHARLPMSGNMSGQHKSPHKGSSVEFAEYRKYVPGDDVRLMDWRVYARTDRFYLKEFEADTNLRAWFVVDCSASMGYASHGMSKLDYARRMAATLAYMLVQQGDAVGLTCFAEKTFLDIPARRNAAHLGNIFEGLKRPETERRNGTRSRACTRSRRESRSAASSSSSRISSRRSRRLLPCFQHFRFRKHDLAVFHLLDRAELISISPIPPGSSISRRNPRSSPSRRSCAPDTSRS